jgi:uncharacterized metal-binding protein YceD (DUF177 family)
MAEGLPLTHSYNLARLGNAGDDVRFAAGEGERAGIAKWSGIPSVERLEVRARIKKLEANRFGLTFDLEAEVTQSCVVTLEPVPAQIRRSFGRELVFVGRRDQADKGDKGPESKAALIDPEEAEEGPEEITSLHFDLAAPALEEFALALDPYPRRPGVQFAPQSGETTPSNNPFAVLKGLK